jgi:hypothetical protein
MKEEIGGFFELWFKGNGEYHHKALKLNSGRNSFGHILKTKSIRKVYLPYYCCNALLEPVIARKVAYEFYQIDLSFEPQFTKKLSPDEYFVYINYFGICDAITRSVADRFDRVIIDNCQAFFSLPFEGIDTFYSPRKFFGVSDGGYLYTSEDVGTGKICEDVSYQRYLYLLKRIDTTAQDAYPLFLENEVCISSLPQRSMSRITRFILSSIDYQWAKKKRNTNYSFLHKRLGGLNKLSLDGNEVSGPHVYPFLVDRDGLREYLISNKIYVATYWKEVMTRTHPSSVEHYFTKYLIPLPIDQRYDRSDMLRICKTIDGYMNRGRGESQRSSPR